MGDLDDLLGKSIPFKSIANEKKKVKFEDEYDSLHNLVFSDEDSQVSLDNNKQEQLAVNTKKLSHLFGLELDNQNEENPADEVLKEDSTLHVTDDNDLEKLSQPLKSSTNLLPSDDLPIASNSKNPVELNTTGGKAMFSNYNEDIMANLADKPRATASAQSKKSSLMEDLFGKEPSALTSETSKTKSTFSSSPSVSRLNSGEFNAAGLSNEATVKNSQGTGYSLSAPREPRRGRRSSTAIQNDPFGYLSASTLQFDEITKPEDKQIATSTAGIAPAKSAASENLPEWLGGSKAPKEQNQEISKAATQSDVVLGDQSVESSKPTLQSNLSSSLSKEELKQSNLTSKLLGIEFSQQAAIVNMQQQEHELRTAAALSQQSEKLNYLLESQKMKLSEQEKQFNALIARQLERQTLIEAQIKAQQDRIDSYIQTLAAQPTTVPLMSIPITQAIIPNETKNADVAVNNEIDSESVSRTTQLGKLCLENILKSLQENHEQEILILEDSYKKQIAHLEESMVQMEKRMQDDIECIEADYKLKIQKLKEDLSDCERVRRQEKALLMEENEKLIRDIQDRHHGNLEVLQKEHSEFIDKITKSKELERQANEIMRTEGTNIQNLLNRSEFIVEHLEDLKKKFENKDKSFCDVQENHFSIQEKNIEYLKKLLECQKEEFDEERQKFMTTVQKLESNICELNKEFQKQNASSKINEENLKSREQALLRDREIFAEQLNWERERLKALMDSRTREEDKQLEWLAQERQALAAERGKLQIFNRLNNQIDGTSKIELEAAIKAAQDAAFIANQEKVKWQAKVTELERSKADLEEEKRRLVGKAKELQDFTQSAISKRDEGLKALKEAHFIEERYKEKLSQMHYQQEIMMEKESKLAAEKLELAKTRLSLHISDVEKPEKDTDSNYCKTSHEKHERNHSDVPTAVDYTKHFKEIVDPHLVVLKWDLENNLDFSQTTF